MGVEIPHSKGQLLGVDRPI